MSKANAREDKDPQGASCSPVTLTIQLNLLKYHLLYMETTRFRKFAAKSVSGPPENRMKIRKPIRHEKFLNGSIPMHSEHRNNPLVLVAAFLREGFLDVFLGEGSGLG